MTHPLEASMSHKNGGMEGWEGDLGAGNAAGEEGEAPGTWAALGGIPPPGRTDGVFPVLELAGNGISIVLLIFTILEFCIAVATANFWCRATRLNSNEVGLGGMDPKNLLP